MLRIVITALLLGSLSGLSCIAQPSELKQTVSLSESLPRVEESAEAMAPSENSALQIKEWPETEVVLEPAIKHAITVLSVPFFPQAPQANWDMPYQEACEEASIIMVAEHFSGNRQSVIGTKVADRLILDLIAWQEANGFGIDLTAYEVAQVLEQRYDIQAQAVPYSAEVIRQELQAKRPVILPAAGRLLGNPYFRQPGPLYHMLVVKGYEGEEFIVNDPGTKRGESFRYHESVFTRAVHDWNGGQVEQGEQVMVIIKGSNN